MEQVQEKNYIIKLEVCGPLHIGSGEVANKKEYVYNPHKEKIEMLNLRKFFELLVAENLSDKYTDFIMSGRKSLYEFILENGLRDKYRDTIRYTMDSKNIITNKQKAGRDQGYSNKKKKPKEVNISLAMKDPYHRPYIPGSSLKGALIQNLLYATALKYKNKFGMVASDDKSIQDRIVQKIYVDKEIDEPDKDKKTAAYLGKIIQVSDSESLSTSTLELAEKVDLVITEREIKESKPNVIREAVKEGTQITFRLKLLRPDIVSEEDLIKAVRRTFNSLYEHYRTKGNLPRQNGAHLYLGGGTGFISKTLHYGLYVDKQKAVDESIKILERKFRKIKRREDRKIGLAPKTIKMARTPQAKKEMGLCKISIEEVIL